MRQGFAVQVWTAGHKLGRTKCGLSNLIRSIRGHYGRSETSVPRSRLDNMYPVPLVAVQEKDPSFTCGPDGYLAGALPAWRRLKDLKICGSVAQEAARYIALFRWSIKISYP
jgi:hypothetical protein